MAEYGQFGQATYDESAKEWYFERSVARRTLKQIEAGTVIVPPATEPTPSREPGSKRLEKQIKALVQSYPELQPASGLLPDLDRVSQVAVDAAERHDPMKGELLAFGSIPDQRSRRPVDVLAFASGLGGSDLHFAKLRKQDRTLHDAVTVDVPTMHGEATVWKGPGVAIQSISFAEPFGENDPVFLAVRLITEVLIFQPTITTGYHSGSATIELSLFFRLNINKTGCLPYVHVAFNPWWTRQFAVVDQASSWTVWELDESKLRGATVVYTDDLLDEQTEGSNAPVDDSWARVMWVKAPNVLAACNRRNLVLFDQERLNSQPLQEAATPLDDGLSWNLDLAVVRVGPNYAILLTTRNIIVYRVEQGDDGTLDPRRLSCNRHFRNPDDLSLRLHVCQEDSGVLLFVRSDLDPTIMYYWLDLHDPDHVTFTEPSQLGMPSVLRSTAVCATVSSMHVRSLSLQEDFDRSVETSLTSRTIERVARYYLITTLYRDMSMLQTLYVLEPGGRWTSFGPSGESSAPLAEPARMPLVPTRLGNEWTISYEKTIKRLNDILHLEVMPVTDVFNAIRAKLQTARSGFAIVNETLQEQVAGELEVNNLEEGVTGLHDIRRELRAVQELGTEEMDKLESAESATHQVLRSISWPRDLRHEGSFDLPSLHLSVMDNWISPLADSMPDHVLSAQTQHALRVATEVALASHVIRPEESPENESGHFIGEYRDFELPIRTDGLPGSSRVTPSLYFDGSSQPRSSARATPVSPGTPSTTTSTEPPPAVIRLSRYTNFSDPPSTTLPRSLNRVLSHWQLRTDPADYDWRSATRRIDRQIEEKENEELPERERIRQQKRRERNERRQQRHEEERQRQDLLNSQAPQILTESQPTQFPTSFGFSQATAGSQMPASQILPGRHGGRPAKKKRKSGF